MKQSVKTVCLFLLCAALLLSTGCIQETPVLDTTTAPVTEPDIGDIPNIPLEEKTINGEFYSKEAQILIAAADAYVQRGKWIQYADTYTDVNQSILRSPHDADQEPERANSQNTLYTNCAAWIYNLFWEAFDYNIRDWYGRAFFDRTDILVYSNTYDEKRTDEQWEQLCKELEEVLVPGDCIVNMYRDAETGKENGGHIILYIGDGKYAHSTGSNYNYEEGREVYEENGSVQYGVLADTYFKPNHRRYLKNFTRWIVVRPLQLIESIPQKSIDRFASMQGIVAQKLTSHPVGTTVNPGDTVSYTIQITNTNKEPVVVEVESTLAENTTMFSDEKLEGNVLKWKFAVEAGETKEISYTVKVSEAAVLGTTISEGVTTVNRIQVYAGDILVGKTLSEEQQQKIVSTALGKVTENGEMTEIIRAVYLEALQFELEFNNDSTLYDSVFKKEGYTSVSIMGDNPMLINGYRCPYGGRYIKLGRGTLRPEQVIRANMLLPGDIIVGKNTLEDTGYIVYLILDSGNLMRMGNGGCEIVGGDMTAPILDSLLSLHSFAVIRPSLSM